MSLVKNVGALSLANILVQSIYFAYSFIFRMILGPQLTGIWNLARLVLGYLSTASAGVEIGSERKIPILYGEGKKDEAVKVRSLLFSYALIEALLVAMILWGYLLFRGGNYGEQEFWALVAVGAYAVFNRLMSCFIISYRTIHQFVNLSKVMVVQALLDVVIILPVLYFFSFYGLLVAFGVSLFFKLVWFDRIRRKNSIFQMKWHFSLKRLKGLLSLGFPIMIGNYFWKIFVTLDSILVVWFMGTTSLAYYTVGAAILIQLSEIPTNVSSVMTPRLFEKFGKSSKTTSLLPDLRRFFSGNLLCIVPILCCLGFFGIPFLVRHLIPEFAEGIIVVQILIFALFIIPQTHIPNQLLVLLKKRIEYSVLILAGISAVASLVLVFHTIHASIGAVALGAISGYAIYFLLLVYRVLSQLYGVGEVWWVYRRFTVGLAGTASVLWGISALFPGTGDSVAGDLLLTLGKGSLALVMVAPLVWFGGTEIGLKEFLLQRMWRRSSSAEAVGDHPAS
jgi:O-antigen/teichoic acid export membrane protein